MYYYSYDNIKRITQTDAGKKIIAQYEKVYNEKYADKPVSSLNYSYIKLFYQTGNRSLHQELYFDRRYRLSILQVLAIADDKWLDELENIISTICDEFTWVLPAHNLTDDKTFDYTDIDLFSAETGFYLAETAYIFQDKLSADIRKRIYLSLEDKIVKNYENNLFKFEARANNWSAVCSCGVGLTYLYAFPERFPLVKARLVQTIETYLSGLGDDGYCFEGSGYWYYGFGFFSIFFDVWYQLTGEWHEMLDRPKVKAALQYFHNARMDGKIFLPFADGGSSAVQANPFYFYVLKNLFGDECVLPTFEETLKIDSKALGVRLLNGTDRFAGKQIAAIKQSGTVYYPSGEIFLYKNENYSFAAKSGHNNEFHNHADVGAFQIVKNEKALIADLGAGEYTFGYFNIYDDSEDGRYGLKTFVCSSFSHSVPIINGKAQKFQSVEYRGEVLKQTDDCFAVELARAYGQEAVSVVATYQMQENSVRAGYVCKGVKESVVFRFISKIAPQIQNGTVVIDGMKIVNDKNLQADVQTVYYHDHSGENVPAYTIDFAVRGKSDFETEFTFLLSSSET